jgi:ribosomal protein S25
VSFYLKKSLRFGPLRFNLSKSGVGISAGVKGLRIGTGPRGNYIHAGRGGIYYRKTLGSGSRGGSNLRIGRAPVIDDVAPNPQVAQPFLSDASSAELVEELNEKRKKTPTFPFCVVVSAVLVGIAIYNGVSVFGVGTLAACLALVCLISATWDRRRKTVVLFYEVESQVLAAFESLYSAFEQVRSCSRVNHLDSTEYYADRKYHAGVLKGVQRSSAVPVVKPPPHVKTNVALCSMPAGKLTLYFCPDRVLIDGPSGIGAAAYSDLRLTIESCRFVESERVFPDQQIVGTTWTYVNKDGSPDRRFHNNPQLPIVAYEELHIKSPTGWSEVYQFSKPGIAKQLTDSINNLGRVLVLTKFWACLDAENVNATTEDGTWCRYANANDLLFRIASIRNKTFVDKISEIRSLCGGPASQRGCELIIEALIGTVLRDWNGLTDRGAPVAFNVDNARAVLTQSVELLAFVTDEAVKLAKPQLRSDELSLANGVACSPAAESADFRLHDEKQSTADEDEELVEKCLEIIRQEKRASTSLLQRRLRLGYTRAARIVDILEQRGILGPGEGAKPREILVDLDAAV